MVLDECIHIASKQQDKTKYNFQTNSKHGLQGSCYYLGDQKIVSKLIVNLKNQHQLAKILPPCINRSIFNVVPQLTRQLISFITHFTDCPQDCLNIYGLALFIIWKLHIDPGVLRHVMEREFSIVDLIVCRVGGNIAVDRSI